MGSEWREDDNKSIVLTKPFSLEEDSHKSTFMLTGALALVKDLRPGSDLTKLQLPPQFNFPKSLLQILGESVYSVRKNMLEKCNKGESKIERFIEVIAWNISNVRPWLFGSGPFNPILGETHHVSFGTLNLLVEQISHHPPVTALHATDEIQNLELLMCQHAVPKFYGTSVVLHMIGKKQLKLMNHGETYLMESPTIHFKVFPKPGVDWTGNVRIQCPETGLEAELSYGGRSYFGLGANPRAVKGTIFDSASLRPLFEIYGQWDKTVMVKNLDNGDTRVIYAAKEVISELPTPILKNPKEVLASESSLVWGEVSKGIINTNWGKASKAKKGVEENQRKLLRERQSKAETWVSKNFIVSYSKQSGWDCEPIKKLVPPAPIVAPLNI